MIRGLCAAAGAAAVALTAGAGQAYRGGPPPGHTGGFGEPTCATCHMAGGAAGEASLSVAAPDSYEPGRRYELRIVLEHPDLAAAGFQLAARFAEGPAAGEQAGRLEATSGDVQVVERAEPAVQYASQTAAGTAGSDGRRSWVVGWTAPRARGPVVFHVAANAANDDSSEFGDIIAAAELRVRPAEKDAP